MNKGQEYSLFEILKAMAFSLACVSLIIPYVGYDECKGLILKTSGEPVIVFACFVIALFFDALQRKFCPPRQKKDVRSAFLLKKIGQKLALLFNDIEIIISFFALPLVIIFSSIYYKDAVSKTIVACSATLFCLRIVYIIDLLDLSRKKE